jgi:AraC family transcriptional regulator
VDISPSAARELGANLKAYPKLSYHISIKGDKDMNYKIVDKGSFIVVGKQRRITMVDGENFKEVPKLGVEEIKDNLPQGYVSVTIPTAIWLYLNQLGHT